MSRPTMKSLIVITALLLASFCWSLGANTIKAEPGEDAVLSCRNVSGKPGMFWGRLVNNGNYSCIANTTKICSGIKDERFEIGSNKSFVSLKIKHVKMEDSGFYFCGFNVFGNEEINVAQLNVGDLKTTAADNFIPDPKDDSDCYRNLWIGMVLGGLGVLLLTAIIVVALKVKKLQRAQGQEHHGPLENQATDNLNYAALNFRPQARRTHRAFQHETNVIYAATR